jgi:hypothetical protein
MPGQSAGMPKIGGLCRCDWRTRRPRTGLSPTRAPATTPSGCGCCAAAGFSPRIVQAATRWAAVWSLVGNGLGVSLVTRLAEGPSGQAVVRVSVSRENMPTRRILTCVCLGSRRNPLIDLGVRALEEVVRDHRAMDNWPQSA